MAQPVSDAAIDGHCAVFRVSNRERQQLK